MGPPITVPGSQGPVSYKTHRGSKDLWEQWGSGRAWDLGRYLGTCGLRSFSLLYPAVGGQIDGAGVAPGTSRVPTYGPSSAVILGVSGISRSDGKEYVRSWKVRLRRIGGKIGCEGGIIEGLDQTRDQAVGPLTAYRRRDVLEACQRREQPLVWSEQCQIGAPGSRVDTEVHRMDNPTCTCRRICPTAFHPI